MTYKETLFFIGKCLTISHEEKNLEIVSKAIKTDIIDWDSVVKVSTSHYVFPALYCNLKRANLLSYLPEDLVSFMKHITDLNRERNIQIIEQAKEINNLLIENGITPIFLKGTGNLLEGLYKDLAERMVGDIDFIVSQANYEKTILLLKNSSYKDTDDRDYHIPLFKHYPRIKKEGRIAAVEIHKEILIKGYHTEFNYDIIVKDPLKIKNTFVVSYDNQLILSIAAKQINDNGQFYNSIALRNAYDVFLLAQKTNSLSALKDCDILYHPLNNFLAICNLTLDSKRISFEINQHSISYQKLFQKILQNSKFAKKHKKRLDLKFYIQRRLNLIGKAFYQKEYRYWLFRRITDRRWQKEKVIQIKSKSKL